MTTAIWWIRRDLRLSDNLALVKAQREAEQIIPLFIVDPALQNSRFVGEKRLAFLGDGLRQLDVALRQRGSYLLVREGHPQAVLAAVMAETGATAVFTEQDFSPYARRRDTAVAEQLPLHFAGHPTVRHPQEVLKKDGTPYVVFTPYRNVWLERPLPALGQTHPAPTQIKTPPLISTNPLPNAPTLPHFPAGEAEGQRRLQQFISGDNPPLFHYKEGRDFVALPATSQISPYLRLGMVSGWQAAAAVAEQLRHPDLSPSARESANAWLNELIWREFYTMILYHFPHVVKGNFRPQYDRITWENDEALFAAWGNGRTGYPIVDAAMRQLTQIGWMHNRARMITASFLVKDLLINWQWGEQFFMQHLVDGDPAANNGGWQWAAGTGTDAAPYFRIFNPTTQGQKFDANGRYIRHWLPELAHVPDKYIHEPAKMPLTVQRQSNCIIGQHYLAPIIDHKIARQRTLEAYKASSRSKQ